jgi:hypothetical protein
MPAQPVLVQRPLPQPKPGKFVLDGVKSAAFVTPFCTEVNQ